MPPLVGPVVEPGAMAALGQPTLDVAPDIVVRPFREDDADAVVAAYADPDIQMWHRTQMRDEAEAAAWISAWPRTWADESDGCWAIARRSTGAVAGRVGLRNVTLPDGCAELTYWVLPAGRRSGLATAAVRAVTGWLLDDLGLRRLEIAHSVRNAPSCRVAIGAGFAFEGTRRSAMLHADGWHDMHMHARVAGDT